MDILTANVQQVELSYLKRAIQSCGRVALILPEYLCHKHLHELKKRSYQYVFVGKEMYSDVEYFFSVHGTVSASLISRFKGVASGGIWQRWIKPAISGFSGEYKDESVSLPKSANMKGNVVVAFVNWLSGMVMGFLCLFAEIRLIMKLAFVKVLKNFFLF